MSGVDPLVPPVAFTLPRSEVRELQTETGAYRLMLAWPSEPAPATGYPVVYLLDANASFGTMVEGIRMRSRRSDATGVVPAVVVGIDYPIDEPDRSTRRTFDCTPSVSISPNAPGREGLPEGASGGAETFLSMLTGDVRAAVARTFPIDVSRQILVGHSLGGLLVLQSLLSAPDAFETHVAISPSIWWDRERVLASPGRTRALAHTRVFLAVGEYEQSLAPWQRPRAHESTASIEGRRRDRRMEDDARALASALADVAGEVVFERIPDADHASALAVGIQRCLRFCLAQRDQTLI